MEPTILQITVLKGPRNGEILVCEPKSKIQIGRVVRGNNVALRDPGISQKHLCFRFIQESSRWFVSDLDTSNGTILNGSRIGASVLVPVSDGDVLKIGEKTELGVKIVTPAVLEEREDGKNVKRGRVTRGSSRVNTRAGFSGVSEEEVNWREAQSRVLAPVKNQRDDARPISARVEMGRKGRGRGKGSIGTRNSARVFEEEKEARDLVTSSYTDTTEVDQNKEPRLRRNPRRGNSSRVLKELDSNCAVDSVVKEVGMKRKGKGRDKEKDEASTAPEEEKENKNGENLVLEISSDSSDSDHVGIPELRKGKGESGNSSLVVEEEEGEEYIRLNEEGERNNQGRVDFEKMTLDQWFDSMDWFLPKVIYDEAEKIINILKEKAQKFDGFLEAGGDVA